MSDKLDSRVEIRISKKDRSILDRLCMIKTCSTSEVIRELINKEYEFCINNQFGKAK